MLDSCVTVHVWAVPNSLTVSHRSVKDAADHPSPHHDHTSIAYTRPAEHGCGSLDKVFKVTFDVEGRFAAYREHAEEPYITSATSSAKAIC